MGKRKPRLTLTALMSEIGERTGNSTRTVANIFNCYEEIVEQCLKNKIEVACGKLGTFTFKEVLPKDYIEWKGFTPDGRYVIFFQENTDGFIKTNFRLNSSFKKKIREETWVPHGSIPSGENVYADSENDIGKPRIDFVQYMKELRKDKEDDSLKEIANDPKEEIDGNDEYDSIILEPEEENNED